MTPLQRVLSAPARRPAATLLLAAVVTLLAIVGAARIRTDASLSAMFPKGDRAANVMIDVLNRFRSADELLILVTLPGNDGPPDPQRLLAFAERFQKALADSPSALALSDGLLYRAEPDAMRFIEKEMAPAAIFYLDDQSLAAARQRLTPAGMRAQLARDQAMLSQPGPAASALAKAMMADPLGLHEFFVSHLAGAQPFPTYQNSDALIAPDGRAILIRVLGKHPPTDFEYAKELCSAMSDAAARADPRGLRVEFSGGYAIAAVSAASIRHDAIVSVVGSVALLLVLFVGVYRRPIRLFHLAFAPVAMGTLWGFGAYGFCLGTLSPIAAVIGGVLAGMGIDYSVLFLTRFESLRAAGSNSRDAAEATLMEIGPAIFAAWITSVAGFVAIGASSVKALRDFSILGTLGLTGSFLAAAIVLPAMVTVLGRRNHRARAANSAFRFRMDGLLQWLQRHRKGVIRFMGALALVALGIALLSPGGMVQPDSDLTAMHPQPNPALEGQREITRRFGRGAETLLVYLKADDSEKLAALAHAVNARLLSQDVRAAGVAGTYGLATWLPDPEIVARCVKNIDPAEADRVMANFKAAVADSGFNDSGFDSYGQFLHDLLSRRDAPTVATLEKYPGLSRSLLPRDAGAAPSEAVTIVFLDHPIEDRASRDAVIDAAGSALRDLPDATLSGLAVVSRDAENAVWRELPRLLAAAGILVAAYLLLHFRNLRDVALSLLPAIFGMALLAVVVRIAGLRLNMVNLVALPLLIGIDVDYGIYLVTLARRGGRAGANSVESRTQTIASGMHAVIVCATSMIAGYASLAFTSIPAMRSLGMVVAAGVLSCVCGAIFLLCPILARNPNE
jgi:predicted RND superfamily exporter protein